MIKKYLVNGVMALALGLIAVSCSKDTDFSNADALKHAESVLGVTIDPNQDWKMTQEVTANVTVNLSTGEEYEIMVFDKNPFENAGAVYYTKKTVSDATVTSLPISVPSALTELYVSVFDSKKHSYSQRIAINGEYVNAVFGAPMENSYAMGFNFTRANTGITYPATHEYKDANGNVIAGANMNHNQWGSTDLQSMPYGGWIVPDPLTEGQKERVRLYFQANPNLGYQDPEYRHFYVQQVYTGGTSAPETGNKEATVSADGQSHQGMTLNQLTVGEACSHINNFNAGTCTASDVLYNDGTTKQDQITLMVNVYDTSCFGYHETSGSNVNPNNNHNDKMALVSAADIDTWAAANGNPGEKVVDGWNRSFMGFDYELLPESDIVEDSYALLSQVPNINNIQYAWDGEKVMTIGEAPEATEAGEVDITSTFAKNATGNDATCEYDENGKIVCTFGLYSAVVFNQTDDWSSYSKLVIEFEGSSPFSGTLQCTKGAPFSKGDTQVEVELSGEVWTGYYGPVISTYTGEGGTLIIKSVKLVKEASASDASIVYYNPTYLLGDADEDKISFYSRNTNMYGGIVRNVSEDEMKTTQDGKTCLDLTFFQGLVSEGYHPITTDLKTWVKWEAACDGYYSDWIVTLTEAQRIIETEEHNDEPEDITPAIYSYAFEDSYMADYDMNDVVVKVRWKDEVNNPGVVIATLCCTGATYDLSVWLTINGSDSKLFGNEVHAALGGAKGSFINTLSFTPSDPKIVYINDVDPATEEFSVPTDTDLSDLDIWIKSPEGNIHVAKQGQDPHGVIIPEDWEWPMEWTSVKIAYPKFADFARDMTTNKDWYKLENQTETPGKIYGK